MEKLKKYLFVHWGASLTVGIVIGLLLAGFFNLVYYDGWSQAWGITKEFGGLPFLAGIAAFIGIQHQIYTADQREKLKNDNQIKALINVIYIEIIANFKTFSRAYTEPHLFFEAYTESSKVLENPLDSLIFYDDHFYISNSSKIGIIGKDLTSEIITCFKRNKDTKPIFYEFISKWSKSEKCEMDTKLDDFREIALIGVKINLDCEGLLNKHYGFSNNEVQSFKKTYEKKLSDLDLDQLFI